MIRRPKLIYLNISITLFLYALITLENPFNKKAQQENHPPVVKIVSPKNNSIVGLDAVINYEISVSDPEDGNSKYDEINSKEVLLEVRRLTGKLKSPVTTNKVVPNDLPGLTVMRTSNCFNCHNFNSKSIGPSFHEISKHYPATPAMTDSLIKHIRDGISGIWGKEVMPTHPELSKDEIKNTVQWILKHGADPEINYYIGTIGSFHITPPAISGQKSIYVLTASYVDHGLKIAPGKQRLKGQDVVIIYRK